MSKKIIALVVVLASIGIIGYIAIQTKNLTNQATDLANPLSPAKKPDQKQAEIKDPSRFSKDRVFSVMLLGIDRRSKNETGFRTDIMILVSVNPAKKKLVMTSVPRDLWINGGRINGLYILNGWESLQDAFYKVTGQKPEAYIRSDFEDWKWLVDAVGGLDITLERSFTDVEYPNDVTKTWMTISYQAGPQHINGTQALQLARSRHGNNGEGSDFARQKRQWLMLQALPNAITSPNSTFNPFDVKNFYNVVSAPEHMQTDLTLGDAKFLWDFYSAKNEYSIETFTVDSTYLYNPPLSEYGGAWVLIAKNNDFSPVHLALKERLGLIEPKPEALQE